MILVIWDHDVLVASGRDLERILGIRYRSFLVASGGLGALLALLGGSGWPPDSLLRGFWAAKRKITAVTCFWKVVGLYSGSVGTLLGVSWAAPGPLLGAPGGLLAALGRLTKLRATPRPEPLGPYPSYSRLSHFTMVHYSNQIFTIVFRGFEIQ